jgi:alpha-D-ribose 1-methylphosphonate 5-triphosphate synthase subunit PhnL
VRMSARASFCYGRRQERTNIARGLCVDCPVMLLDEPTASLRGLQRG